MRKRIQKLPDNPETSILKKGDAIWHNNTEGTVIFRNDNNTYALHFGRGFPAKWNVPRDQIMVKEKGPRFEELSIFREHEKKKRTGRNVPHNL